MASGLENIETIESPFRRFVTTIGVFPTAFTDAMTYYECLAYLVKYMEDTMIPAINENAEAVKELQELYIQLKSYVDNYFDNLDVQDEINNKLDQLVADGTLQRILNSPATTESLGGVIIGDGLQVDENGKIDVKAGDGITVDEDGVSVTPHEQYIKDITVNDVRYTNGDTNTYIHYSIVPSEYQPEFIMSDPTNPNGGARASEIDYEYTPTLMANLSAWDTTNHTTYGPLIIDGEIKVQNNLGSGTMWNRPIIAVQESGRILNIDGSTPADEVTAKYACRAWTCLYNAGETNPNLDTAYEPRTFLAQDYDGNYLIGVCGGRRADDTGMTLADIISFVRTTLSFNARLIYNLDGGGSSNLLYHGLRQNELVEREDRVCPNWIIWRSPTAVKDGTFINQSLNNMQNIEEEIKNDGHIIGASTIQTTMAGNSRISPTVTSRIFMPNPRSVTYNLNFNITGEGTLASYSDLFINLPKTSANYYFLMLKHAGYTQVPVYITAASDGKHSRISNITALDPGTYSIHFTTQCEEQY